MSSDLLELEHLLSRIGAFVLIRFGEVIFDTRGQCPAEDTLAPFEMVDTNMRPWGLFYYREVMDKNRYVLIANGYGDIDVQKIYKGLEAAFRVQTEQQYQFGVN